MFNLKKSKSREQKRTVLYYFALPSLTATVFLPSGWPLIHLITVTGFLFLFLFLVLSLRGRVALGYRFSAGIIMAVAMGLFLSLYSVYLDSSNAYANGLRVFVVGMIAYALMVAVIANLESGCRVLVDVVYISSALVTIVILTYIATKLLGLSFPFDFLPLDHRFGMSESGFFAYSTNNLRVLFFTVPFMLGHQLAADTQKGVGWKRRLVLLSSIVVGFLSSRLAFYIVVALSLLVFFIFFAGMKQKMRLLASGVVAVCFVWLFVVAYLPPDVMDSFVHVKLSAKMEGEDPRYRQLQEWGHLIAMAPLLGHGVGSMYSSGGSIVNIYGYELSYHMLIAEIGILPFIFYASMFVIIVTSLGANHKVEHDHFENGIAVGMLLGLIGVLSANATNGYLMTFGSLWAVFFPLAFLQWKKIQRGNRSRTVEGGYDHRGREYD